MDKDKIIERIKQIENAANDAIKDADELMRLRRCRAFVVFTIDSTGDESYTVTITEVGPNNHEARGIRSGQIKDGVRRHH